MNKIIIGCDPDSSKSGFALFVDGKLTELDCLPLMGFYFSLDNLCEKYGEANIELHIENVKVIKGIYQQRVNGKNKAQSMMVAQNVGMCKQVQTEIERIAEQLNIKVVHHGVSKMWKDSKLGKAALADLGWQVQSNEDSRSAAYFGYLGVKQSKLKPPAA